MLPVPGVDDAVKHAKWFWEPSETSGFVTIPKGKFRMGENRPYPEKESAYEYETEHDVEIAKSFELHRHPVTVGVYRLLDPLRSPAHGELHPIVNVSFFDARVAAVWLHGDLPTEQQWERACRGPVNVQDDRTFFWSGDKPEDLARVAWYYKNSGDHTHPVIGSPDDKPANDFGLYHMHGQVWEWTSSWYAQQAWLATRTENPRYRGLSRVWRGGSFYDYANLCRSSYRSYDRPQYAYHRNGFRVSRA